jgi:hypothetical protein
MSPAPGNHDRTDQAALFGAALAAILTLVFGEGPWEPLGVVFGVVLLSVVAAYYRPQPSTGWVDAITKASAFAAVLALSGFILLAYPIQQWLIRPRYPNPDPSAPELRICPDLGTRATPGATPRELYEDCIGKITTSWGWLVCLILFVLAVVGWYAWTRPVRRSRDDYVSFRSTLARGRPSGRRDRDRHQLGSASRSPGAPAGSGAARPSAQEGCARPEGPA